MTDRWSHVDEEFPNRQSLGASVVTSDGETGFYIGGLRAYENNTFKGWYYGPEEQFTVIDLVAGKKRKVGDMIPQYFLPIYAHSAVRRKDCR